MSPSSVFTARGAGTAILRISTGNVVVCGMGFDYFYGFMGGETDQWTPYLFQNMTQIFPWVEKPGYNLTTDLADEAIASSPASLLWHEASTEKAVIYLGADLSCRQNATHSRDIDRLLNHPLGRPCP